MEEEKKKTYRERRAQKKEVKLLQRMDFISSVKEAFTGIPSFKGDREYIEQFYYKEKIEIKKHSKYTTKEKITFIAAGITAINIFLLLVCYIYGFIHLKQSVLTSNSFYMATSCVIPFVAWVVASDEDFWAFYKRKRVFFYACCLNLALTLLQPLYSVIANIVVPQIIKIPTNPLLTRSMIIFLGYILIFALFSLAVYILYVQLEPLILSDYLKRKIETFRLEQTIGRIKHNAYSYCIKAIKNLETGKSIVIHEIDRFLQGVLNGPSGTGKTSSVGESIIRDDMDQKVINREKRQEALLEMIQQGRATIQGPLSKFDESAVIPVGKTKGQKEKNAKELAKIRKKYPDCGMTIVAPNNSMNEHIIRMAEARGIEVNVVDPLHHYTHFSNVKMVSLNPFYIPFGLEENERVIRIADAANVYSDVLIATNQMGGQSDVYFTDISLSVSYNISSVVMLANNIQGKQTYIDDIQDCTSNFENLKPYVEIIEREFDIEVDAAETNNKNIGKIDADSLANRINTGQKISPKKAAAARKNPYYQQILFVKKELLGSGAEAMFSQARGVRNLTNKILQDPRIKRRLSAEEHERLDFDRILANNEITIVNTAIELGKNISTSFGLFFLLNHRTAVLRRPKETRTPHFFFNDECAQYIHPFYDDVIALYRQYRVAAILTLQTLTQLEKSSATAYLKNVFLGAGTHIVFGRIGTEEMRIYSEMAGISRENEVQKTITETSLLATNPTRSDSERMTPKINNNLEGADIRMRGFLELTIFTVNQGRVLDGQLGRVFFVGEDAYDKQPIREIMWEKLVPEAFREPDDEDLVSKSLKDENKNLSVNNDMIPTEEEEVVMVQSKPALKSIEGVENMSLNELYSMLIANTKKVSSEIGMEQSQSAVIPKDNDWDDEFDDVDYKAASRAFNNSKG